MIDTHVHLVSGDRARYPLDRVDHPGHEWVDVAPDAGIFLGGFAEANLDGAVLVQPHGAYRTDNRYVCDAAAGDNRLAAVVIVDMTRPDRAGQAEAWADRGAAGLRLFSIPTPDRRWLDDPTTDDAWELAAERGLTIGVCVFPGELDAVAVAARRHPGQAVVLDHCGFAPLADIDAPATRALLALADLDNVVLKVTTPVLDAWTGAGRPVEAVLPMLIDRFGPDRIVWGSDHAQIHDRPHHQLVELGRRAMAELSPAAAASVAHRTAARLWFR